jgi:hypothetical protein
VSRYAVKTLPEKGVWVNVGLAVGVGDLVRLDVIDGVGVRVCVWVLVVLHVGLIVEVSVTVGDGVLVDV